MSPITVWLLSDGAPGHLSQSRGIVDALATRRAVAITTIELKVRSTLWKRIGRIALPRIRDWLKLLELEHQATSFMAYSPPLARKDWLARWQFMESTGARCWPLAAGVYGVVAVKRQRGLRLITPRWAPAKPARAMLVAGGNDRNPLTRSSDNETLHD